MKKGKNNNFNANNLTAYEVAIGIIDNINEMYKKKFPFEDYAKIIMNHEYQEDDLSAIVSMLVVNYLYTYDGVNALKFLEAVHKNYPELPLNMTLGDFYRNIYDDEEKAIKYYEEAKNNSEEESLFAAYGYALCVIGVERFNEGKRELGFYYLFEAAKKYGNLPAYFLLGYMYDHGYGVEKNHTLAESAFLAGARQGEFNEKYRPQYYDKEYLTLCYKALADHRIEAMKNSLDYKAAEEYLKKAHALEANGETFENPIKFG